MINFCSAEIYNELQLFCVCLCVSNIISIFDVWIRNLLTTKTSVLCSPQEVLHIYQLKFPDGVLSPGDTRESERSDWLPDPSPSEGDSGQTPGRGAEWEDHDLERIRHCSNIFCGLWTGSLIHPGRSAQQSNFLSSRFLSSSRFSPRRDRHKCMDATEINPDC